MVDSTLLFAVVIFVLAAILIFKLVKGIIKALMLVIALLAIVLAAGVGLVAYDTYTFAQAFGNEPILFLLVDEGKATGGVAISGGVEELISQQDVERWSLFLNERDVPVLTKDYYKVILVDKGLLLENDIEDGRYNDDLQSKDFNERNEAFAGMITNTLESPFLVARNIRDDRIRVRPETFAFKAINLLPESITSEISRRFKQAIERVFKENEN
jgi:hypothetical protein